MYTRVKMILLNIVNDLSLLFIERKKRFIENHEKTLENEQSLHNKIANPYISRRTKNLIPTMPLLLG